jgi:hypothetical protein
LAWQLSLDPADFSQRARKACAILESALIRGALVASAAL